MDVDLTLLGSTMVYSEVYNMVYYPEEYIGKSVRMKGSYVRAEDPQTGNVYHGCIIQDATACCSQGIEFVLAKGAYPEELDEITVKGVFDTYMEDGQYYCTLRDATLEAVESF